MDKKIIKGLIDEKLEVIQEQFSIIKGYEGKIPAIELDLIMSSIRDLYELVLSLQVENIGSALPKQPQIHEEPKPVPPPQPVIQEEPVAAVRLSPSFLSFEPVNIASPEPEPPEVASPAPETFTPAPEPEPTPEPEPEPEPIPEPAPEPIPEHIPEHIPEPLPQQEKPQRMTFDLFTDSTGSTLADRLREGQEKRIADKLQENKVVDLRSTIGINDKFLFINELFEGNMRIYDDVIQKLNTAVTLAQADMLMLDLKIAYNWDSESPTVKKFVELVRRKF